MTTLSAGQSADITIADGTARVFSTTGEALVRIKSGARGAGFDTFRVAPGAPVTLGPYSGSTVVATMVCLSGTASESETAPGARVFGLAANSPLSAVTNAGLIQAALANRGRIYVDEPGDIYFPGTAALTLYSGTSLVLGQQTRLVQADGTQGPLLVNSAWKSPKVTVTNGITDSAVTPAFGGRRLAVADCGANAHGLVAGDGVLVRGDTTRTYNGVHRVVSILDAFRFTFYVSKKTALGSSAGTVTCEAANINIEVAGGHWDYNGRNNQTSGGIAAMAMIFSKVGNLHLHDTIISDPLKYCAYIVNSARTRVIGVTFDGASDGVHLHGFTQNAVCENLSGQSGDDFVAYTSTNAGYTQYDWLNSDGSDSMSTGGDLLGFKLRNILPSRCGEDVVAIYPLGGNSVEGVVVDVFGTDQDSANCLFVCATGGSGTAGSVKDITLRNARGIGRSNTLLFGRSTDTNGVTFDKIDIAGIYPNGTYSGSGGLIAYNKATVTKQVIEPRSKMVLDITAARYFMQMDANTTFVDTTIADAELASSGAGNFASLIALNGTPGVIKIVRPNLSGTSQLFANIGTISGTPTFMVTDWRVDTSRLAWINFACRLEVRGGKANAPSTPPICIYSTAAADLVALGNDWGTATNWLQIGTAAGDTPTVNLYHGMHAAAAASTPAINWVATAPTVNLRTSDGSLPVDASKFASIKSGAIFYNSGAGYGAGVGLYGMGAAASTRIAA